MDFFVEHIKMLQKLGHTVELATNLNREMSPEVKKLKCKVYDIKFSRTPFSVDNFRAMKSFETIVKNGNYDIVHTHTPNASAIVRMKCKKYRKQLGLKVFYTTHGFHFYKGAPAINWLLYYPMEWICAHYTDELITINKEDYKLACKKMKAVNVDYVPGIGIDVEKITKNKVNRDTIRKKLGLEDSNIAFLSVGELNQNKNHISVLHALANLKTKGKLNNVKYLICGQGIKEKELSEYIKNNNLTDNVVLLGFRQDILEIYQAVDCFVFPSFREGLSVSVMEAMANGLPVLCSKIRGNEDLIDSSGGSLFSPYDERKIERCIEDYLKCADQDIYKMKEYNKRKVKKFDKKNILDSLHKVYFK